MKTKLAMIDFIKQFHLKSTKIILIRHIKFRDDGFRYKLRLKSENGREKEI